MSTPTKVAKYYDQIMVFRNYTTGKTLLVFGRTAEGLYCAINENLKVVTGKFPSNHWQIVSPSPPKSGFADFYVGE